MAIEGETTILLIREDGRRTYLVRPRAGGRVPVEGGDVPADEVLSRDFGDAIVSPNGKRFWILPPTTADRMAKADRRTQILYPKDAGYLLLRLGIGAGARVGEMGTGSGSMTLALAATVGETGRVFSYDNRAEHQETARRNLERAGLLPRVEFRTVEAGDDLGETDLDAFFLDLPEPAAAASAVHAALAPGRPLGLLVPTTNQLQAASLALRSSGFFVEEHCEILLRRYKVREEAGVRPEDRMIGHTGFLLIARAVRRSGAA